MTAEAQDVGTGVDVVVGLGGNVVTAVVQGRVQSEGGCTVTGSQEVVSVHTPVTDVVISGGDSYYLQPEHLQMEAGSHYCHGTRHERRNWLAK